MNGGRMVDVETRSETLSRDLGEKIMRSMVAPTDSIIGLVRPYAERIADLERQVAATRELLALLHRDGGEHTNSVGIVASCADAAVEVLKLRDALLYAAVK